MTRCSQFLLVSLISLIAFPACTNRAPSLRMLDTRAGYDAGLGDDDVSLYQGRQRGDETLVRKSAPRAVKVWIYPHELPSKDWFMGGYVRMEVTQEQWVFDSMDSEDEDDMPAVKEVKKPARHSKKQVKTNAAS